LPGLMNSPNGDIMLPRRLRRARVRIAPRRTRTYCPGLCGKTRRCGRSANRCRRSTRRCRRCRSYCKPPPPKTWCPFGYRAACL
jgi:hypothetical protein